MNFGGCGGGGIVGSISKTKVCPSDVLIPYVCAGMKLLLIIMFPEVVGRTACW